MAAAADARPTHGVRSMVGLHLPPGAGHRARPAAGRSEGRLGEIRHVRAQYLQDWLVDPAVAADLAAAEGPRRLGRARRHRRAHRRPGPVHHRRADHRRQRTDRDLRAASGRSPRRRARPARRRGGRPGGTGTGDGGRRRDLPRPVRAAAPSASSRPPGSPPAARTRSGSRSTAPAGSIAFDFEDMNVLQFYDADEPGRTAGFRRIIVTEADHPYVGALVAGRARPRLRARLHPPGGRPRRRAIAAGEQTARRRSPTACRCSGARRRRAQRATAARWAVDRDPGRPPRRPHERTPR